MTATPSHYIGHTPEADSVIIWIEHDPSASYTRSVQPTATKALKRTAYQLPATLWRKLANARTLLLSELLVDSPQAPRHPGPELTITGVRYELTT